MNLLGVIKAYDRYYEVSSMIESLEKEKCILLSELTHYGLVGLPKYKYKYEERNT